MPRYHYGKHPAVRPHGLATLSTYVRGRLPAPPSDVVAPTAPYPMDGNNQIGDCTIAGAAHLVAAWDFEVHEHDAVPSETTVTNTYFTLTGGVDSGLDEAAVLAYWRGFGLFGEKIVAYAPVNHGNLVELHQAVAFYGGAYLGIACPQSAQEQFADGVPWTYVPGSPVEGGHCIVAIGYNALGLECATWGGVATVTYPFLAHFLDEAWAVIPHQFVEAHRGPELDLASLKADLDRLR